MNGIETSDDIFDTLSPLQNKAIRVLLTRGSVTQAVKITGIARVTFYRWMEDANFRAVLHHHSKSILDNVSNQLVMAAEDAVAVLTSTLHDPAASNNTKLRAAAIILENVMRMVALSDMSNRISTLERLENIGGLNEFSQSGHSFTAA